MPPDETLLYAEYFDGGAAGSWPAPWQVLGGLIDSGVDADGGYMLGEVTTVGRLYLDSLAEIDFDVTFTVMFEDWTAQGVGVYVRQNAGWLDHTDPPGAGYAIYIEGATFGAMGVWREHEGMETLEDNYFIPGGLLDNTPYRVRFQCEQSGAQTQLRARIWPAGAMEPFGWNVEHADGTPALQDVPGTIAVDMYNYSMPLTTHIDDIEVRSLD